MALIKTQEQIALLREAGHIHAQILNQLESMIQVGISALELDKHAHDLVIAAGGTPSFLGYRPDRSYPKYPASLCVSLNDVIVHGIPDTQTIIKNGDVVSIDLGLHYRGVFTDSARTIAVGQVDSRVQKLIDDTYEALSRGIQAAEAGNTIGDIGYAIERFNAGRYGSPEELSGHGVGTAVHEDPYVPNFGKPGKGMALQPGMVLAIEPMFHIGGSAVIFHKDHYTVSTRDKSLSAHAEHTVLITEDGPKILTG